MAKKVAKPPKSNGRAEKPSPEDFDPLDLLLDPSNPRLAPSEKRKSQERLREVMLERFAIDEIAESICSAGFLPLDPFIGYRDGDHVYVLEGNRRVATLQLLLKPELAPERFVQRWKDFQSRLDEAALDKIRHIPVQVYTDRRNAGILAYIGYRHVNGVLPWDAQEKAAYIAQLIEDKHIEWSYTEIADRIGSKPGYVEKLYVAHRLIEQATDEDVEGTGNMRNRFGVLTRALQSPGVTRFLGVEFPHDPEKSSRPSTKPNRNLEDFVRWTFGVAEGIKPVLEDSRDLTKWGQILDSDDAVRYLRTAKDPRFERAFSKSGGLREGLVDALMTAADYLAEAVPLIRQHKDQEDVKSAVDRCADYLSQILIHVPDIARRQGLEVQGAAAS